MDTISTEVTGARHLRAQRNGQDAAVTVVRDDVAVAVVCDGCSSGAHSEVGARLAAQLFANLVADRLASGASPTDAAMWASARAALVDVLADLAGRLGKRCPTPCSRVPREGEEKWCPTPCSVIDATVVRDHFLFTIVAAGVRGDEAAVWALGDGAYAFGEAPVSDGAPVRCGVTRELGPFEDNAPPYLGYDLLGEPREAVLAIAPPGWGSIVVATDGASELPDGLAPFAAKRFVEHPDALRRSLVVLARGRERIDWTGQCVERTPAVLQDDCAIAVIRRRGA